MTTKPESPCFVRADASQFDTAIVNLAVNARDAMDGEGTLTLTLSCGRAKPAIRGHAGLSTPFVTLGVGDTGAGIAAESVARIFEPFFTTQGGRQGHGPRPLAGHRLREAVRRRRRRRERRRSWDHVHAVPAAGPMRRSWTSSRTPSMTTPQADDEGPVYPGGRGQRGDRALLHADPARPGLRRDPDGDRGGGARGDRGGDRPATTRCSRTSSCREWAASSWRSGCGRLTPACRWS